MSVIDLPEVKEKKFSKLEKDFGITFKNKELLIQAFIHRSYLNEHHDFPLGHNERLEFIGQSARASVQLLAERVVVVGALVGVAANKLVAKVASRLVKPWGEYIVADGDGRLPRTLEKSLIGDPPPSEIRAIARGSIS